MNELILAMAATCTISGNFTTCTDGTSEWFNGVNQTDVRYPNGQTQHIVQSGNHLMINGTPGTSLGQSLVRPMQAPVLDSSFGPEPLD